MILRGIAAATGSAQFHQVSLGDAPVIPRVDQPGNRFIGDPDGHRLRFGQSFQQPSPTRDPLRQLRKILPELPVDDVPAAVAYYRDVLGFKVNHAQHDLGVMDRDDITILLIARTERHTGIRSCYVYVKDADLLHAELLAKGANVQGEPVSHPWGLRDFHVLDPDGNQIRFGHTFE